MKKSGKPIFYIESAGDVLGIDGRTGKPFTGVFHRINESAKDDLNMIINEVNVLIRAATALYFNYLRTPDPNLDKLNVREDYARRGMITVLEEIDDIETRLRIMAGKKEGRVVFEQWWNQMLFGLMPIKW